MKASSTRRQGRSPSARPAVPASAGAAARVEAGWKRWLPGAGLVLLALAAYLPALRAGFIWDDDAMTESPLVKSAGGLWKIWAPHALGAREVHYWPLVYTTFWLEHLLFGLKPLVFHLDNILLHGVCCVLLWRVLRRLGVPGAWLGAALFAVHPVHVESVAWIIERKDVLSGALGLGAALAYLKFDEHRSHKSYGTYFLALALFTLAMLSKSIVVTLPVALGIVVWWKRGRLRGRDFAALAPLALVAVAVTIIDLRHMAHWNVEGETYASGMSLTERALVASRAVWIYLGKLAWPHPLAPFYPKWDVNPAHPTAWLPLGAWAAVLAGLWAMRGRIGRGPLAAAAVYAVTLGPVLGLVDFQALDFSWVADRFQYLASAGPIALAAAGLAGVAERLERGEGWKHVGTAVLLGALGLPCFQRAGLYRDSLTLYGAARETYPECAMGHYVYAYALLGDDGRGIREGRGGEILGCLEKSMSLRPDAMTAILTGQVQGELGDTGAADASFRRASELKPKSAVVLSDWAEVLEKTGRREEAVAKFREALRLRPNLPEALGGLGSALRVEQKFEEAGRCLEQAVALAPRNAHFRNNYGLVLANQKKGAEAVAQFEAVLEMDQNNADAHNCLGLMMLEQGKLAEATEHFEALLRLTPQPAATYHRLGQIYERLGNAGEAVRCYRGALDVQADFALAAERLRALGAEGK